MKASDPPVIIEESYGTPKASLWNAITDPNQMRSWFFEQIIEFKPEVGFETEFELEHNEKTYVHMWKIVEVDPTNTIRYQWRYRDTPGVGNVLWDLTEVSPTTSKLTLTNSVTESFPDDDPAFRRESAEEGWDYLLRESLKSYLESDS